MTDFADYEIVIAISPDSLARKIVDFIGKGWQPIGGVAMIQESDTDQKGVHILYAQAVGRVRTTHQV